MTTNLPRIPLFLLVLLAAHNTWLHAQDGGAVPNAPHLGGGSLPASADADPIGQADALLARATDVLESYHSITANVGYEADLFGKPLTGKGDYREQRSGPIPKIRLELRIPLGNKTGAMVEVCDGRYLWTYLRLADEEELTKVDVQRVAQAAAGAGEDAPTMFHGRTLGMGGLAGLVRELWRNFRFELVGPVEFGGLPAWQLRGGWRADRLAAIMPEQKDAILRGEQPNWEKLPAHLPSHVALTLGRDNLVPYRIEYRRPAAQSKHDPDTGASAGSTGRVILVLEWFNISGDEPSRPSDFEYHPGDVEYSDVTEMFIQRLKTRSSKRGPAPSPR